MRHRTILALIFVLALTATSSITWGVFEAMPHIEDEFANYFQAQVFASGQWWAPSPPQPNSFLIPFAVDLNGRRFSKYPPGFAAVLALGVLSGAHWLINPLIGALTLLMVYAIGRDVFDAETGLLAALLGLLSPMFLGLTSSLLQHSLCALCLLIFTWCYFKIYLASNAPCSISILGGAALGAAALTRPYTALAYAAPLALLAAWQVARTRRAALLRTYGLMGLVGALLALSLLLYTYALTGQFMIEMYSLVWPYDRIGFGPGHGVLPGGHTLGVAVLNAGIDLNDLATVLLGWPYLSWLPVLLGLTLPPRRDVSRIVFLPFVAIVVAHGAYWIQGSSLYGPRYYYEASPLLWLLASHGVCKLWHRVQATRFKTLGLVLMRVALAILVGVNVLGVMPARFEFWRGLYGVTRGPRDQITSLGIHNALVFVRIQHWGDYSELAWTNTLALDGDVVFALDEDPAANEAVMAAYPGRRVFYLIDNVLAEVQHEK